MIMFCVCALMASALCVVHGQHDHDHDHDHGPTKDAEFHAGAVTLEIIHEFEEGALNATDFIPHVQEDVLDRESYFVDAVLAMAGTPLDDLKSDFSAHAPETELSEAEALHEIELLRSLLVEVGAEVTTFTASANFTDAAYEVLVESLEHHALEMQEMSHIGEAEEEPVDHDDEPTSAEKWGYAVLMSLVSSFVVPLLGGLFFIFGIDLHKYLHDLTALAVGCLVGAATLVLLPEVGEELGLNKTTSSLLLLGLALGFVTESLLHCHHDGHHHHFGHEHAHDHEAAQEVELAPKKFDENADESDAGEGATESSEEEHRVHVHDHSHTRSHGHGHGRIVTLLDENGERVYLPWRQWPTFVW
ncbi:MAG: hypothetical protein MHM6MM_007452, partial [Cercozoa sp. M6MM]